MLASELLFFGMPQSAADRRGLQLSQQRVLLRGAVRLIYLKRLKWREAPVLQCQSNFLVAVVLWATRRLAPNLILIY